ncbi:TonB-dependent receptor plug domain-containing protein, partial [uncultured Paracoccus sp.]|uniref:TonB-dependent receptor plug domain-containing protein n=1 Tax=uncultured Paracoccus sp. TaxID=189685 RepID=UPI0025D5418C
MATFHSRLVSGTSLSLLMSVGLVVAPVHAQDTADVTVLEEIVLTAEEQAKQALGASTITAEELEKTPVANDISEIVRKMPGVNLTGNSASGQYGNNRQIDIRGMGPENTLILIDGKPVLARNSAKMGRAGERDTRGDSNWVAPELIERIEVLRGPAAARYGSGSSGGVVNIITKR